MNNQYLLNSNQTNMLTELIIAIDIGTTNLKVVVFNMKGTIVSESSHEVKNIFNRLGPTWVELDAEYIWLSLCSVLRSAISKISINYKIIGVGVTTLRQTIVPVDKNGDPLRYAIPWHIKSTYSQADWIKNNIGAEKIYKITGLNIDPLWALPSIIYLRDKEREIFKKTYMLLEIQDFIVKKLGSVDFVTDYTQASCLSIFDINDLIWSQEILDIIGLSRDVLPKVVPPGQIVGKISKKVSELTGIPVNCPIVLAGGDSHCSSLGCGVIKENDSSVVIGTSAVAMACRDKLIFDPKMRLVIHPYSVQGLYILDHNTLTGGIAYRWFRDQFCELEKNNAQILKTNSYKIIDLQIKNVPIGSNGVLFLPHFVGAASPYWNDLASGVFLGLRANTTKWDMGRSIIEGVAIEVQKGFNIMETLGVRINEIRLSGGGCFLDSPWTKILANVFGKPILLLGTNETTALGAAILCAYGVGFFNTINEAVNEMVHITNVVEPDKNATLKYQEILPLHDKAYNVLADSGIYKDLSKTTQKYYNFNLC